MTFEPGDLVLLPFPFTDLSASKVRPALVVSSKAHNRAGPDVVVCGVTSNLSNADFSVLIGPADVDGRLPVASRVKVAKLVAIEQALVRRKVGRLKPAALGQVRKELRALLTLA